MRITNISADVRIVNYGSPFELDENIVVEERVRAADHPAQFRWQRAWGTNELSNDYAYTEAQSRALSIVNARLSTSGIGRIE